MTEASKLRMLFETVGDAAAISSMRKMDAGLRQIEASGSRMGGVLRTAFGTMGGFIGAQVVGRIFEFGRGILMANANAETMMMSLETVAGGRAQKIYDNLQDFAKQTPFEFPELVQSAINLESFGLKTDEWMTTIGDTASAMGKSVDQVTQAVLDAQGNQFERLKELGIMATVEGDKLKFTYMKNGQQIVEEVDKNNKALVNSTIQGIWNSKYQGAMEKQSKSFIGQYSTLKDNIMMRLQEMTGGIFGFVTKGLGFLNDIFANGFRDTVVATFGEGAGELIDKVGSIASGFGELAGAFIGAFGEGKKVSDIVKELPGPLQAIGAPLAYIGDMFGDIWARYRSGGTRGLFGFIADEFQDMVGRITTENVAATDNSITKMLGLDRTEEELRAAGDKGEAEGKRFGERVLNAIKGAFGGGEGGGGIGGLKETIRKVLTYELIPSDASIVDEWIARTGGWARGLRSSMETQFRAVGSAAIDMLFQGAMDRWLSFDEWLNTRAQAAVLAVGILTDTLWQSGVDLISGIYGGAEEKWLDFTTFLEEIKDEIPVYVGSLYGVLIQAGRDAVQGLIDGATEKLGALGGVVDSILAIWGRIPGMGNSPWPSMIEAARDAMDGLIIGARSRQGRLASEVGSAIGAFGGVASPSLSLSRQPAMSRLGGSGSGGNTYIFEGSIVGGDIERFIQSKIDSGQVKRVNRSIRGARLAESY